ncbi:MAG: prepilin-type N-terminal cleavage/methylation domain-containing protein, partial [bacterium]|nr:prepilin-type N-terminal cleavage/methylation domain-containing protein [bacterium]
MRSTRYKEKQGITLIEILIAFVIMMVVMVAIIGFMTRTRTNTTFDEARVFASSLASDVMKNLMG